MKCLLPRGNVTFDLIFSTQAQKAVNRSVVGSYYRDLDVPDYNVIWRAENVRNWLIPVVSGHL